MTDRSEFRLRLWRKVRRISASELARASGLPKAQIVRLENGSGRYTQDALEALSSALDCTPAQLLSPPPNDDAIRVCDPWRHPEAAEGHFIRAWRKSRRLTLDEVSRLTGMTHTNLSRIERGQVPYSQRTLERLAPALGTDPGSLITRHPDVAEITSIIDQLGSTQRDLLTKFADFLLTDADQTPKAREPNDAAKVARVGASRPTKRPIKTPPITADAADRPISTTLSKTSQAKLDAIRRMDFRRRGK